MIPSEAARILRAIVAAWPHQEFPEDTILLWSRILAPYHFEDAADVVAGLAESETWFRMPDFTERVRSQEARRCRVCGSDAWSWLGSDGRCGDCAAKGLPVPRRGPGLVAHMLSDVLPTDRRSLPGGD